MSSSNLVRLAFIEETTYGVTPVAGNFSTARFTSEGLSGTPDTTESQQLRTDRMSSGQILVGLSVEGAMSFELAKESALEKFLASAMYNDWATQALVTVDIEVDSVNKELTRASGDWAAALVVGDIITLDGFSNTENNVPVMITEIVSATVVKYAGPTGMVDEVGSGTTYKRADKLTIGTTKKSFSIEKKFTDLTTKGINYRGMIASQMELSIAHGEIVTGSFTFSGNGYETADSAAELITDGRTVNAPATTQSMNGSVDMPFLASSAVGTFGSSAFDIQNISLSLNNNVTAQNVIGTIAPKDYSAGTAGIEISMSAYLKNEVWAILGKKLTQEAFAIGFMVKNLDGWYGFYMPAIQVSFPDPSAAGINQDVILDMAGTAKVGSNGESALTIYRPN